MPVIGVTGTNGKTTTAYLLCAILDAAGLRAGMLGTVAYRIAGEDREASRTTPEAPDVQQLLNEMLEQGSRSAVMEVSSHALSLKRVDGMTFAAGVFTNLTRDHLDFHDDMEAYFAPSGDCSRCFRPERPASSTSMTRGERLRRDLEPADHLRHQQPGRRHPWIDRDDAGRVARGRHDAGRRRPRDLEARWPAQRLQHPRRHRYGGVARRADRCSRARRRRSCRCARAVRSGVASRRRRHRRRRLRAHRRCVAELCWRPRVRWRRSASSPCSAAAAIAIARSGR